MTVITLIKKKVRINKMQTDIFVESFLKDDKGKPIKNHALHSIWHQHIEWSRENGLYSGIIAPRGISKTESIIIGLTLYYLYEDTNNRIKIVSNSDSNAKARVGSIKKYIEEDDEYRALAPNVRPAYKPAFYDKKKQTLSHSTMKDDWQKHMFNIERSSKSKDASVESSGILAAPVGGRADFLLFDDIVDLRNTVEMPALQPLVQGSFSGVWMPILAPTGFCVYVATPWTDNDNTQVVIESPQWSFCVMRLSNRIDCIEVSFTNIDETHPCYHMNKGNFEINLWKEMWSRQAYLQRKATMTDADFARAYFCRPFSFEDLMFPSFEQCMDDDITPEDWLACVRKRLNDETKVKTSVSFITGVDLSSAKRPGNVIFTAGLLHEEGKIVPVDIRTGKWTSPELAKQIGEVFMQFRPSAILVENVALQEMLLEWMEQEIKNNRLPPMPLEGFLTGKQKADPVMGLPGMEVEFKNMMWMVPNKQRINHDALCECEWCRFIREMKTYPFSATTDMIMACFVSGTQVMTYEGYKNIEDIKCGELVYTHKGRWRKVTQTFKREFKGRLINVVPFGSNNIFVTPEHPFYTAKLKRIPPTLKEVFDSESIDFREVGSLKRRRHTTNQDVLLSVVSGKVDVFSNILNDDEWGFFIGLYLAEGFTGDHQIHFALHKDEQEVISFLIYFINEKLNRNVSLNYSKTTKGVVAYFTDKKLKKHLLDMCGTKSHNKKLPMKFLLAPKSFQLAVLKGWLVGDGSYTIKRKSNIAGASTSRNLIWQMKMFALRNNISGRVNVHEKGGIRKVGGNDKPSRIRKSWKLILNSDLNHMFIANSEVINKVFFNKYSSLFIPQNNHDVCKIIQIDSNVLQYSKIRSMYEANYDGFVYNLEVEEDNSYLVEDTVVHNCWFSREGMRKYCGMGSVVMQEKDYNEIKDVKSVANASVEKLESFYAGLYAHPAGDSEYEAGAGLRW